MSHVLTTVASHDEDPRPTAIFLPFPNRNAISGGIKTKAKTNRFWGNFQPFTCQAELLEMPDWSDLTADSSWHSQMQTNYTSASDTGERKDNSFKYIRDSEPMFHVSFSPT